MNLRSAYRNVFLILFLTALLAFAANRPAKADLPGAETLTTLRHTTLPGRDPVDLARRYLGIAAPPATPAAPKAYNIGDVETFAAEDDSGSKSFSLQAQLWYATPHTYWWFQVGFTPNMDQIKPSADRFENAIYPTVHKYFGSEASPGIDNDVHLFVVHARGLGAGIAAYYDSQSEYPKSVMPSSNEHEMFFVNLDSMPPKQLGSPYYEGVLAHEFQHMVHHNQHPNEAGWIDEGLSELSSSLNGYLDLGFAPEFMAAPETQLNTWAQGQRSIAHYGAAYSFATYFFQRYGADAIHDLMTNKPNGLENFRAALQEVNATDPATNKPVMLEDLFADWTITNLLNDPKVGDGRYSYSRFKTHLVTPPVKSISPTDAPQPVSSNQWGTVYLKIDQPGTYKFTFDGQPTVKVVPADPHGGKMLWWSNRDDRSDTRLTHAFDLSMVRTATLSYWLWYATETDWDYGYISVSTDGGATWKALASEDSAQAGGHNNPYGPGYTGHGADKPSIQDIPWRHETVDLSAYAGQKILVRFEMMTDDAYNEPGMLIDDISIPEINYATDAETDNGGWTPEGWVRTDNTLPQQYLIQMVEYGATPRVFRLLGPTDGTKGEWTLTVGGDVSQLVIAVSGLTEFTTEPAPFQYSLTLAQP